MHAALRRLVPPTLRRQARAFLDRRAFNRLPPVEIAADYLSDPLDVAALLSRTVTTWPHTYEELLALELPDETGGMTPGECRLLYYLAAYIRPTAVLEIGTHIGASTVHLAAALRDHTASGTLTTVDVVDVNAARGPWRTLGSAPPRDMVHRIGMGDRTRFIVAPALDFLARAGERFDLILLDGDHAAEAVYREVPAALRCLRPGGLIVLHDYFQDLQRIFRDPPLPGPYLALERLRGQHPDIGVQTFPPLPWPTKHGTRRTCLALVVRRPTAA